MYIIFSIFICLCDTNLIKLCYVIFLQQVCSGMINKVGEQLFAILDVSNGTISAKDICGMVNYNIKTSPRRQMLIKKKS